MLTVFFEIANLLNEKPVGKQLHDIEDGSYLCPNDLLLGRATSCIPSGPFKMTTSPKQRYNFIQKLVDAYWIKWIRYYFPSLIIREPLHTERRNVKCGDIVLLQDSNVIHGNWKMAKVCKSYVGDGNKVRKVDVEYKNLNPAEDTKIYKGKSFARVKRPVQKACGVASDRLRRTMKIRCRPVFCYKSNF